MRVLHFLTQRPGWTGSGTTLHALVGWGQQQGLEQRVLCLLPVGEDVPSVGGLDPAHLQVIRCGEGGELPFAIPGMSDVMPYASTVFGEMDAEQLGVYGQVLGTRLARSLNEFQPDVIHAHHAWIGAGIACELAGSVPVVLHGHGTGLRQMGLLPRLAEGVRAALSRIAAVCVLHEQHAEDYARVLALDESQVHIVGAGFDQEIFVPGSSSAPRGRLLFAGKWAAAKGLGPLLTAFSQLRVQRPEIELAVAGAGSGEEGRRLEQRLEDTPGVCSLGRLRPGELAAAMVQSQLLVLPSLFEGLPLVLVEAAASGCRLVCTDLPGVRSGLAEALGDRLHLCPMPELMGPDSLAPGAEAGFVQNLEATLAEALDAGPAPPVTPQTCAPFAWTRVAERVHRVWRGVVPI